MGNWARSADGVLSGGESPREVGGGAQLGR